MTQLPDLIVFDLETTGRFFVEHEILEIGAVRVSADLQTLRGEFNEKVKPEHIESAEPKALEVVGYRPEDWQNARPLKDVLIEFGDFAKGGMLAGYNVAFDWGFLGYEFHRLGIAPDIDYHRFDVFSLALAKQLRAGKLTGLRLHEVQASLGLPPRPEPHRALADAKATLAVLQALVNPRINH